MRARRAAILDHVVAARRGKELEAATSNMKRFVTGRQRDTFLWEEGVVSVLPTLQADIDTIRCVVFARPGGVWGLGACRAVQCRVGGAIRWRQCLALGRSG